MSTIRSPPNKQSSRSARRQYHRIPTEDGTYPIQPQFNVPVTTSRPKPKQPNRTTKTSQKLTLFPEDIALSQPSQVLPEELLIPEAEDLYGQLTQVPPERIGKLDRKKLPRVTAYCTANAYRLDDLMTFLKSLPNLITQPKKLDECVYIAIPSKAGQSLPVPRYPNFSDSFSNSYTKPDPTSAGEETKLSIPNSPPLFPDRMGTASADGPSRSESAQLSDDLNTSHGQISINQSHDSIPPVPSRDSQRDLESNIRPQRAPESENFRNNVGEVFYFDYGVVVMWGLTEDEESRVLKQVRGFEEESLEKDDIETEAFVFHYNANYQPRIYNDIITLKSPSNYMAKLTISHAIAQSTKLTLFEGLIEETIEKTKNVPECMAKTGKVELSRSAITKKIGQLFIMRINVNLVSNVLDTPEIFWSEPALEPLYQAIRGYLEISQRVELVNQRVAVISDLLDMLKEHLTSSHGEQLEWIVIILIAFEIIIGIITICFDYFSYLRETKDGGS